MLLNLYIKKNEIGLRFDRGEFTAILQPGKHRILNLLRRIGVAVISTRDVYLRHAQLDEIVRSGALQGLADVYELSDRQRALVYIDGRFDTILGPGLHVLMNGARRVRVDIYDINLPRLEVADLESVTRNNTAHLLVHDVPADHVAVVMLNGKQIDTLTPGRYAYWKGVGNLRVINIDRREVIVEVNAQESLTADKVTLRMNAQFTYRVTDVEKALATADDIKTVLYRDFQLALRMAVGTRDLDTLLNDKEVVTAEIVGAIRPRAATYGVDVVTMGIRDLILPGEMRDLLNKVIEARKAAEAGVITRREEAAALRHQANAAKLYAENPTLLRLRELEAIEKIAVHGKLNIVTGDKGLADRITNLI